MTPTSPVSDWRLVHPDDEAVDDVAASDQCDPLASLQALPILFGR